jgi:predicted DNA-binding protein
MAVMSIRIPEEKRKKLKAIASIEGKSMSSIVSELIDDYVAETWERLKDREELREIMNVSESSFLDWDNNEDEVYNDL